MFPLRVDTENRVFPVLTLTLIFLNVGFFLFAQMEFPGGTDAQVYGYIPNHHQPLTIITAGFSHANWMHLLGNMWYLWLFGRAVEDDFGPFGFLGLYTLSIFFSALTHMLFSISDRDIPLIGASGATASLMIAYLLVLPKAKADVWASNALYLLLRTTQGDKYSHGGWRGVVTIPASWVVLMGVGLDIANGVSTMGSSGGGVAHWGHIGGYLSGGLIGLILRKYLRTGMQLAHIRLQPAEIRGQNNLPEIRNLPPEPESIWVNWQAIRDQLAKDAWPPKLLSLVQEENREDLDVLTQRILETQQSLGNKSRVQTLKTVRALLNY